MVEIFGDEVLCECVANSLKTHGSPRLLTAACLSIAVCLSRNAPALREFSSSFVRIARSCLSRPFAYEYIPRLVDKIVSVMLSLDNDELREITKEYGG